MTTNRKTPTQYETRTIVEHAMRRLFEAQGRDWSEYCPDDAQRAEWIEQALTTADQGLDSLNAERGDWKVPRKVNMRPVAEVSGLSKPADDLAKVG